MDHAKVLFRFGSIVEFGKSPIGGKLVSGNLISLKAVVECPAEGSGKWKSSHSTHNLSIPFWYNSEGNWLMVDTLRFEHDSDGHRVRGVLPFQVESSASIVATVVPSNALQY